MDYAALAARIKAWGRELGFQAVGIAAIDLSVAESRLLEWLDRGWHGDMDYMSRHAGLRAHPERLVDGVSAVRAWLSEIADARAMDTQLALSAADDDFLL